jgi:hypothetical protein
MLAPELAQIAALATHFAGARDWRWKGNIVIDFQFQTMSDYFNAKSDLANLVLSSPSYPVSAHGRDQVERILSPDSCELDFYGVTFRLTCKERVATPRGSAGVTQVKVVECQPPDDFLAALAKLRNGGGY